MAESPITSDFLHPLFDATSNYRAASQGSIWGRDSGRSSIKRFFLDLLRQMYLKQKWMSSTNVVEPGVFPPGVYELHYDLWKRKKRLRNVQEDYGSLSDCESTEEPNTPIAAEKQESALAFVGAGAPPKAYCFDSSSSEQASGSRPEEDKIEFTGENITFRRDNPRCKHFEIKSDSPITPLRRWLAVLVSPDLIADIANALGQRIRQEDGDDGYQVLNAAYRYMVPQRSQPRDADASKTAFSVAVLLALAPGLEWETDADGRFDPLRVNFDHYCPVLPSCYHVGFFKGPLVTYARVPS